MGRLGFAQITLLDSIKPNRHPFPLPDEIFSQLSNYKYFSQLDLSDAFLTN